MDKLSVLTTDAFIESVGFYSTPNGLYRALAKNEHVAQLQNAIESSEIAPNHIRTFVAELSSSFHRGQRFPHEAALAGICVAIEHLSNDFTEEFLFDLARVKVMEMPFAPKVAGTCVANLFQTPKTSDRLEKCRFTIDVEESAFNIDYQYHQTSLVDRTAAESVIDVQCDA